MAEQTGSKDVRRRLSRWVKRVVDGFRESTERAADSVSDLFRPAPLRPKPAVARQPVTRRRRM